MTKSATVLKIEEFQKRCLGLATGAKVTYEQYEAARSELIEDTLIALRLPAWLKDCRYGSQFWSFIKPRFKTYLERREFLWGEFKPLLDYAERLGTGPASVTLIEKLEICSSTSVHDAWQRCFERRENDPEGAITSARTLLESTCKYILDSLAQSYASDEDLPKLYKLTAKALRLSPDQHNEQIFRQILGGCGSVVEGMGALRNKFGDAHGKGAVNFKPSRRHAELAVNLSGTICSFLISTFEEKSVIEKANKRFVPSVTAGTG